MDITDRMGHVKDQVRQHRLEERLERAQRDNLGLRAESEALKDEHRDITERLAAIERTAVSSPRRHRLRTFMSVAALAGGSYVMGAKAGRQRYEDIRAWMSSVTRKGREAAEEFRTRAEGVAEDAAVVSERLSDAGQVVGETVQTIAQGPSPTAVGRPSGAPSNVSSGS